MTQASKIKPEDALKLQEAWLWLRKTENICQMVADQDTHEISEVATVRSVIAESFGCDGWTAFKQQLDHHREQVKLLFNELFESTLFSVAKVW